MLAQSLILWTQTHANTCTNHHFPSYLQCYHPKLQHTKNSVSHHSQILTASTTPHHPHKGHKAVKDNNDDNWWSI